jgi:hypothetical protein
MAMDKQFVCLDIGIKEGCHLIIVFKKNGMVLEINTLNRRINDKNIKAKGLIYLGTSIHNTPTLNTVSTA